MRLLLSVIHRIHSSTYSIHSKYISSHLQMHTGLITHVLVPAAYCEIPLTCCSYHLLLLEKASSLLTLGNLLNLLSK